MGLGLALACPFWFLLPAVGSFSPGLVIRLCYLGAVAPVLEEIWCRGFIYRLFNLGIGRRRKGWRPAQAAFAVIMSAGIFTWFQSFDADLRQLGALQYAAFAALGLACGFCRYRYRSSMGSAAVHGAYNVGLYIRVLVISL